MRRLLIAMAMAVCPLMGAAQTANSIVLGIADNHILPRFAVLAEASQALSDAAAQDCSATSQSLRSAYSVAFDAWVSASHLRFGPTEVEDRAFALAFWPDSREVTPRALATMIADQDPIAASPTGYPQVSIAARGFYALEFLLYDDALGAAGDAAYHCTLVQTVSGDIANTTAAILLDWKTDYAARLTQTGPDATYRSKEEVLQEMFKALSTGLQFTSDTRLGRPLGTFDRPRPTRAEAWRSGRSARHVSLSLAALDDLARRLSVGDPDLAGRIEASFLTATSRLAALDDPTFGSVSAPQTRIKVEVIQQSIDAIRALVAQELGPTLGVDAGFNSLDGD